MFYARFGGHSWVHVFIHICSQCTLYCRWEEEKRRLNEGRREKRTEHRCMKTALAATDRESERERAYEIFKSAVEINFLKLISFLRSARLFSHFFSVFSMWPGGGALCGRLARCYLCIRGIFLCHFKLAPFSSVSGFFFIHGHVTFLTWQ